nr:hypothetical protein [Oscillospiraceae bacterium]
MPTQTKKFTGFTGNQLKLIAMLAMTCDHVGVQLLPDVLILRIIGRLALPIFAYMIAEGCRHTRSRRKYLLRIALLAAVCQVVYFFAMGSLYQCILVTFSLSILLIYALDNLQEHPGLPARLLALGTLVAVFGLCVVLPDFLPGFEIDYGLMGVLLPVLIYFGRPAHHFLLAGLILLSFAYGGIQWWSLAAIPLLGQYNDQRGKYPIGKWFYIYYPLHLVVIYGISLLK